MATAAEDTTTRTSMQALKPTTDIAPTTTMGFATLQSFELMQRAAKLLAASTLVPQEYRRNLANCVIALNMAQRIGADPLLVMQNLYVVHGRPGWSAQFLIACFNQCGRFSAIRYRWVGTKGKDDWGCQAYATEHSSGEEIEGPVITIALAKEEKWYEKSGSKWKTIPQLMLMYRAAAWLVRTHAPEISMGLQTTEELHDVYEARRGDDGTYEVTLDSLRQAEHATAEAAEEAEDAEVIEGETEEADAPVASEEMIKLALSTLEAAKSEKQLENVWKDIQKQFANAGVEMPLDVSAKHRELAEVHEGNV